MAGQPRTQAKTGSAAGRGGRRAPAPVPPREDRPLFAVLLCLGAYLAFTGIDTSAKWLVTHDIPTAQVVFTRYQVHLVLAVSLAMATAQPLFASRARGLELLRGAALLTSTVMNFWALAYLPLAMTSAILFTAPLWICLLSVPLLGERIGPHRWAALAAGFAGILVITRPWTAPAHPAMLFCLVAAFATAIYAIITRRLAGVDPTSTQQVYAAAAAAVGTLPLALADWVWPSDLPGWLAFCLIGVFGWGGHQLLTIAHRYAPASALAPLIYIQILYMVTSGWLVFAQVPDVAVLGGAAIVVASGVYIWWRERPGRRR